jgi:lipopolysaccharide export system protein LptA
VVADQKTGDAVADGAVKVSYLQVGESKGTAGARESKGGASADDGEPVHVVAARAELKHDAGTAVFYGAADSPARLWQGASQVEAPVIQFEQKQKRLAARGSGQGAPMAVHAVLTSAARPDRPRAGADAAKASVFQIASRELAYSDEKREAQFTGGVEVTSADGRMLGQRATVYLQAARTGGAEAAMEGAHVPGAGHEAPGSFGAGHEAPGLFGGIMGGGVEQMVVDGDIVLDQPGRRASGEHLVYTAGDGTFVLTGTPSAPPKVVDEQRGTVTGTLLEFHAGDESVVVSNGGSGAGHRVRTETRVKKQR